MGASSGKLVINSHNATENAKPDQPVEGNPEAASQETPTIVNGHAEGEHIKEADGTAENQVNGDVPATDSKDKIAESTPEKIQKKQKNSIIRIPHRFSKINFSFNLGGKKRSKTSTTEEPEAPQEAQTTEQTNDESAIVGVADSLVQQVIESASEAHTSALEEQKDVPQSLEAVSHVTEEVITQSPPPVATESPIETRLDVQEISQQLDTEISVVSNKMEVIANGDQEIHEKINNHIIDFNNTNNTAFEYVNGDSHPVCDNDAILTKLTNLELTNGHSDHVVDVPVAINGQD